MHNTTFCGISCIALKPTKRHRIAVWECMLGTVYAMNETGEIKYFDYDTHGAAVFAGVAAEKDARLFRNSIHYNRTEYPRVNQKVLYVLRAEQ